MFLRTIIKLLNWLTKRLTMEQTKLELQSDVLTAQIIQLERTQAVANRDAAIAAKMSKAIVGLIDV